METPLLNGDAEGDYVAVRSLKQGREMFWAETVKLWRIGGPIALAILCQYGTNSLTTIFVGHIGDIELSSVSISLSVIGTFSFGFLLGMGSALENKLEQGGGGDDGTNETMGWTGLELGRNS